jgi:uncharacterized BrkB/YihY/UPF0761 family membrane protein
MKDTLARIIQCAISIGIGSALLVYFDTPENRQTRWVAALVGGFLAAWALTYLWVRMKDLPVIVRRLTRAR